MPLEVRNSQGRLIVDDNVKNLGTVATNVLGALQDYAGAPVFWTFDNYKPTWYPTPTRLPRLTPIDGAVPLTIIMPNNGASGTGSAVFSAFAGTLYHLRHDFTLESGYMDVFDASGTLIWSAESAKKIPRVVDVITFTYQELIDGKTVTIGSNVGFMLNNFIGMYDRNPTSIDRWCAMFWMYANGQFTIQLKISDTYTTDDLAMIKVIKTYGWKLFVYKFAG